MPRTIRGEREVDRFKLVRKMHEDCVLLHKGAGDGGWAIDFHTELDLPDAINLATLLEPLHPYFCEDLIRSENVVSYETIRERTRVPIAVGEQFGYKWDINTLIESQLIDYTRVTLPNVGGISEFMKVIALAETHYVGHDSALHGSDRRSRAGALPHRDFDHLADGDARRRQPHVAVSAEGLRLQGRKLWPNDRPGLGIEVDLEQANTARRIRDVSRGNVAEPSSGRLLRELVARPSSNQFIVRRCASAHSPVISK